MGFHGIGVVVNYVNDAVDHVFLTAGRVEQVGLGRQFVDFGVAPYLNLRGLGNMKHVFKNIKVPEFLIHYVESFKSDKVHVQAIFEWNVIDLGQTGHAGLQVQAAPIVLPTAFDAVLLVGEVASAGQELVLVPQFEAVENGL